MLGISARVLNVAVLALISIIVFIPSGHAQDVRFEATVDAKTISLAESLQLTLTVEGGKFEDAPDLPAIDGFDARYVGPSTRVSIINGQVSSMASHVYVLVPRKTGKFQIPALSVKVDGKNYTSSPIDIEVVDAAAAGQQPALSGSGGGSVDIGDKIFVTMSVPRDEAYLNEKVPVTVKLFVSDLPIQDIQLPQLALDGAIADDGFEHQQYQQVVGGVQYQVVEFKTYVYPTRTGEIKLGPVKITCGLMFESKQRSAPNRFDEFFGDEFFNRFLNTYEKRPYTVQSGDVSLKVLPWPTEDQPADFSGAVGQFNFEASTGPAEVTLGDPVTLKLKVTGEGNLRNAKLPSLGNSAEFKTYDAQTKEAPGGRSSEQIVIPQSDTITQVPALGFSFFDPQSKSFKTVTQGPFPLKVNKPKAGEDFKMLQFSSAGQKPEEALPEETFGRDIIFIKDHPGAWRDLRHPWYAGWGYRVLILLTIIAWAGLVAFFEWTHRLSSDTALARRLLAPKKARRGLQDAQRLLAESKNGEFYDLLFKTMQEYFGDKFHLSAGGITFANVDERLRERNVPAAIRENVRVLFEDCDAVRYAGSGPGEGRMETELKRLQETIDHLERNVR